MINFGFIVPLLAEAGTLIEALEESQALNLKGRTLYLGRIKNKNIAVTVSETGSLVQHLVLIGIRRDLSSPAR